MKPNKGSSDKKLMKRKPDNKADDKWVLRLYVAGQSTKALTALANLRKI